MQTNRTKIVALLCICSLFLTGCVLDNSVTTDGNDTTALSDTTTGAENRTADQEITTESLTLASLGMSRDGCVLISSSGFGEAEIYRLYAGNPDLVSERYIAYIEYYRTEVPDYNFFAGNGDIAVYNTYCNTISLVDLKILTARIASRAQDGKMQTPEEFCNALSESSCLSLLCFFPTDLSAFAGGCCAVGSDLTDHTAPDSGIPALIFEFFNDRGLNIQHFGPPPADNYATGNKERAYISALFIALIL